MPLESAHPSGTPREYPPIWNFPGAPLFLVGVDAVKSQLFAMLARGRGVHFSRSLPPEWYEQLTSERRVVRLAALSVAIRNGPPVACALTDSESAMPSRSAERGMSSNKEHALTPEQRQAWDEHMLKYNGFVDSTGDLRSQGRPSGRYSGSWRCSLQVEGKCW